MKPEETDKIKEVGGVECTVFESKEFLQIVVRMLGNKTIRGHIHQLHQLFRLINDGCAVAPCKNSSKKTSDLNVLLPAEQVRNGHGIVFNKIWLIIFSCFPVEKFF